MNIYGIHFFPPFGLKFQARCRQTKTGGWKREKGSCLQDMHSLEIWKGQVHQAHFTPGICDSPMVKHPLHNTNAWCRHSDTFTVLTAFPSEQESVSCLMDVSIFISAATWELKPDMQSDGCCFLSFHSRSCSFSPWAIRHPLSLQSRQLDKKCNLE